MHRVGTATGHHAGALASTVDEEVARGCGAGLLIAAFTAGGVQPIARRIDAGRRAQCPFLRLWGGDCPIDPVVLRESCSGALDRAAGGSLLIDGVEAMPPTRKPSDAVRLIYPLNIIHLVAAECPSCVTHAVDAQEVQVNQPVAPAFLQ